jgi:hypothetical protein
VTGVPDPAPETPAGPPAQRPLPRAALGAALTVVLVLAAIGGFVGAGTADHPTRPPAPMIAPEGVLDLATVPEVAAVEFRYAADHLDRFRGFRCWCGCEAAFDHRSLADCFVRPDGRWEAHGAGCAVCLAEARMAREALEAGTTPDRIATDIDARFGPDPNLPLGDTTKDT